MTKRRTLLVISSDIEADRAQVSAPRRDYDALAAVLDADILDYGSIRRSSWGARVSKLGRGVAMAIAALAARSKYETFFLDGEHCGLPYAALSRFYPSRRARCVVLAHYLTPPKKHAIARFARPAIDTLIVHCEPQARRASTQLGFRPDQLTVLPYQVDANFWIPQDRRAEALISTAGLECRDYDTLLRALPGIKAQVCIGAASNWSHKANALSGRILPRGVTVATYNYEALRDLYARSAFVVVPLLDVDFQAGITTILEAMAMGKAVIVSQTPGQRDAVVGPLWSRDMEAWPDADVGDATGIYVRPGDADAFHAAMRFLLDHPDIASKLGANGRRRVEEQFTLETFARRFGDAIAGRPASVATERPALVSAGG